MGKDINQWPQHRIDLKQQYPHVITLLIPPILTDGRESRKFVTIWRNNTSVLNYKTCFGKLIKSTVVEARYYFYSLRYSNSQRASITEDGISLPKYVL